MIIRTPVLWLSGCLTLFIAMTTQAGPPFASDANRWYVTLANAESCENLPFGFSCIGIDGSENYDIKGNYEYSWVSIRECGNEFDIDTGIFTDRYRELGCIVPLGAISGSNNRVIVAASLDPEASNCFSNGYMYIFDPATGEQWSPYAFESIKNVSGQWEDPLESGSGPINRRMQTYDYVSETVVKWSFHCLESFGDRMRKGGFSIDDVFFPFAGINDPGWSSFFISKCNERNNPFN